MTSFNALVQSPDKDTGCLVYHLSKDAVDIWKPRYRSFEAGGLMLSASNILGISLVFFVISFFYIYSYSKNCKALDQGALEARVYSITTSRNQIAWKILSDEVHFSPLARAPT